MGVEGKEMDLSAMCDCEYFVYTFWFVICICTQLAGPVFKAGPVRSLSGANHIQVRESAFGINQVHLKTGSSCNSEWSKLDPGTGVV